MNSRFYRRCRGQKPHRPVQQVCARIPSGIRSRACLEHIPRRSGLLATNPRRFPRFPMGMTTSQCWMPQLRRQYLCSQSITASEATPPLECQQSVTSPASPPFPRPTMEPPSAHSMRSIPLPRMASTAHPAASVAAPPKRAASPTLAVQATSSMPSVQFAWRRLSIRRMPTGEDRGLGTVGSHRVSGVRDSRDSLGRIGRVLTLAVRFLRGLMIFFGSFSLT